jgi:alkanesulfonate monooxygenase SsuD/methylene tetrahydromethanopterin reductase-like flavin-dependent oxidoreductase (luciferase family)
MKYGIYLPTFTPFGRPQIIAQLALEAEQAGWDGVFIWDDIAGFNAADMADPWISLAAAAVLTQHVRLGALITPLARRRPWKLARETASLDHLSGGRLVVGVGVGGGSEQYDDLGEEPDQRTRAEMTDEGLQILTGLWSGETFSYSGRYYQIQSTCFRPPPVQQPRIPIWVGGYWPHKRPLRRMARWDGMFPLFPAGDAQEQQERLQQTVAAVMNLRRAALPDAEERPFDVIHGGATSGKNHDQDHAYIQGFARAGATWWLEWLAPEYNGKTRSFEELRQRVLAGPPRGS